MQNWVDQHPAALGIAALITFFVGWPLTLIATSYASGWACLAQQLAFTGEYVGPTWQFQNGRMRFMISYRNALTVGADSTGLYLAPTLSIFSAGHPPLLIPWNRIAVTEAEFLFFRRILLDLGVDSPVPFSISGTLGDRLRSAAGSNWPHERIG